MVPTSISNSYTVSKNGIFRYLNLPRRSIGSLLTLSDEVHVYAFLDSNKFTQLTLDKRGPCHEIAVYWKTFYLNKLGIKDQVLRMQTEDMTMVLVNIWWDEKLEDMDEDQAKEYV